MSSFRTLIHHEPESSRRTSDCTVVVFCSYPDSDCPPPTGLLHSKMLYKLIFIRKGSSLPTYGFGRCDPRRAASGTCHSMMRAMSVLIIHRETQEWGTSSVPSLHQPFLKRFTSSLCTSKCSQQSTGTVPYWLVTDTWFTRLLRQPWGLGNGDGSMTSGGSYFGQNVCGIELIEFSKFPLLVYDALFAKHHPTLRKYHFVPLLTSQRRTPVSVTVKSPIVQRRKNDV